MMTMKMAIAAFTLSLLGVSTASSAPNKDAGPAQSASAVAVSKAATLFGSQAPAGTATRTVVLTPGMNSVRVNSGETVAFRVGEKAIEWTFIEALNGGSLELALLFPEAPQANGVYVYISPSQIFTGG
ncbi:CzcE family metal-binding protein [Cupriavidus sp. CP313]